MKKVVFILLGFFLLLTVNPVFAGFELIQTKKAVNINEADAPKLKIELDKLLTELAVVKAQLSQPNIDSFTYDLASTRLDVLQIKLESVSNRLKEIQGIKKDYRETKVNSITSAGVNSSQIIEQEKIPKIQIRPEGLQLRTGMTFPKTIITVRDLALYLLQSIDYKLVIMPMRKTETLQIFSRIISKEVFDGSIKSIENALLSAAGSDVNLVVDNKNKLVTFEYAPSANFN